MTHQSPNVVLICCDDLGWGDLGCFGAPNIRTPAIDRLAREGVRFTNWYAGAPVCTPSRASLLTGQYPQRVGLAGGALQPDADRGLDPAERTLADGVSDRGGATACIGKWHVGYQDSYHPLAHGFDSYFGIPYSHDMRPNNIHGRGDAHPPLPLYRDRKVIEREPALETLTRRYTSAAVEFISEHATDTEPFCCYLAHAMPHVPLARSDRFAGTSPRGLYGDVVGELDWSVHRIMDTLRSQDIADETLVIFTSDHGPWLSMEAAGGRAGPLTGGKFTLDEGGPRVPMIARWPNQIPAGTTCTELASSLDVLPTIDRLMGTGNPERGIDGHDLTAVLSAPDSEPSPRDRYFYSNVQGEIGAIRTAAGWKYNAETESLYQLYEDVGESRDRSDDRPVVLERLTRELRSFAL